MNVQIKFAYMKGEESIQVLSFAIDRRQSLAYIPHLSLSLASLLQLRSLLLPMNPSITTQALLQFLPSLHARSGACRVHRLSYQTSLLLFRFCIISSPFSGCALFVHGDIFDLSFSCRCLSLPTIGEIGKSRSTFAGGRIIVVTTTHGGVSHGIVI